MPELPEVETVRRGLTRLIIKKTVLSVDHNKDKSFPNSPQDVDRFLIGSSVVSVRRRAKVLLIDLDSNYTLMIHLKMTGQLVYVDRAGSSGSSIERDFGANARNTASRIANTVKRVSQPSGQKLADSQDYQTTGSADILGGEGRWGAGHPNDSLIHSLPDRSTRVTIHFKDGTKLYFNDQRRFGWVKLLPTELVAQEPFMLKVGPEPLEPEFTDKVFLSRVKRRKGTTIKAAILDQTVLAGIGNIYADEGLWAVKLHPATVVRNVSDPKLRDLRLALVDVLRLSIAKGGSTNKNYVDAEGKKGSYMDFANVFRREGLPCPRCQDEIEKSRVAGRGTHTCPTCQATPSALK